MTETTLEFLSTGNPTGLKFTVERGAHRCLFDFGLEYAPGRALFSQGLAPRAGRELDDLRAAGAAPAIEGVYADDGWDGRTAVFISHLHLDHTSLVRHLHPDVPLNYPEGMEDSRSAAVAAGHLGWREPAGTVRADGETVRWGEISVTFLPVDHDVPGACGFLVESPDLRLAFTGDQRWHGLHPERQSAFCAAARGVDVLVQEAVTLGFEMAGRTTEAGVIEGFQELLSRAPALVVVNLTALNRERVAAFAGDALRHGRRFVMEPAAAVMAGGGERLSPGIVEAARQRPRDFVLALGYDALPFLIDLAPPPGSLYVHSNGTPLGAFDPAYGVMEAWVRRFGLEFRALSSTGHAFPEDIARTVREVGPRTVLPVHSRAPELLSVPGVRTLVPEAGRTYRAGTLKAGV